MDFAPIVDQRIFQRHAAGQKKREARSFVAEHEQTHFAADPAVITFFGFFHQRNMAVQFLLRAESDAVDAREHFVVFIVLPVCAGLLCDFKGFERLGIAQMRADAHVDIFSLLIKADYRVLWQIADMLYFVFFAAAFHQFYGFFAGQDKGFERQIFFDNLAHFFFDRGKITVVQLCIPEIYVIIKALFGCRAVTEIRVRVQPFDCLRHNMRGCVPDDMQFFCGVGTFTDCSVVANDFHR